MLRINYRCVQSPNISVDFAKCVKMFHKFTQYTHCLSVTKNDLSWLNNLFMVRFQLMRMSSYATNKIQNHVLSPNISVAVAKCGENIHKFTLYTHFLSVTKNDLYWLNYLFMVRFKLIVCPLMLRTNYRCVQSPNISVQSPNISVNVAKICTNSHTTLTLYLLQKMICLDWTIYSW